jgi:hypothetical protein
LKNVQKEALPERAEGSGGHPAFFRFCPMRVIQHLFIKRLSGREKGPLDDKQSDNPSISNTFN